MRFLAPILCLTAVVVFLSLRTDTGDQDPDTPYATAAAPGSIAHSRLPDDGLAPRAPNPWFYLERAYPQGEIPLAAWRQAQLQARALKEAARQAVQREVTEKVVASWQPAGPNNVGGRITDLAVDPTDENIVYAGAAEGGVVRTLDGGQTWQPVFDEQPTLAVGAVAIDPTEPSTIYAGTGEVNPGGGSVAYGGVGLFRSRDRGESWESLGLELSGAIGRIRIDPTNPDRIFVAAMGQLWTTNPERGVYRTLDGGATWERILYVNDMTGCVDLIMRPDVPDVLLAAMWERIRQPTYYDYGGPGCAVYRSDDGGDTWSLVEGGLPIPDSSGGRIGLSLCASQPDVMHAIYCDNIGYFDGLYSSTDGGGTWTRTNDGNLADVFASFGWWFGNVRTHPQDPEIIYVLGLPFYRSTNGGVSYQDASHIMHVDHHALAFGPGTSPVIYNGNDGGVYRSTNGGSLWVKLPDLPITQVYRVALDANNPVALYGGFQDNGTNRTVTGALDDWEHIFGGDGFQALIHPANSNRIWVQYQYGNVYYTSNGGAFWSSATDGIDFSDRRNWNSPLIQDPTDPDTRYFGTQRLYRSLNNTSWTPISGDLTGGPYGGNSGQVDGTLTTLAVSPQDGNVIWTGSDDGQVHVTTSGGAFWQNVSAALPDRWITSVRGDPHHRETAYVTLSGFRWAEPLSHVYRTADLGLNWDPIAGNLPEAPVNDLIVDPLFSGRYFVATDLGVYETRDGGTTWAVMGLDLPNVVVTALALRDEQRVLIAATYGRSFFSLQIEEPTAIHADPDPEVADNRTVVGRTLAPYPNPSPGTTRIRWELPRAESVRIEIVTVAGRRVLTREIQTTKAGRGGFDWDGRDARGRRLASGIYLVTVYAGSERLGSETVVVRR
jgi:photosystem II stability/assembly factor-like uncharacterized protein